MPTPCRPPETAYPPPPNLPPHVQDGHDYFNRGLTLGGVDIHGNAAAIIDHLHSAVSAERYFDMAAVTGQGLVNRVVHHFIDQVVQAAGTG